jgi:hypothetical protein
VRLRPAIGMITDMRLLLSCAALASRTLQIPPVDIDRKTAAGSIELTGKVKQTGADEWYAVIALVPASVA